MELDDFVGVDSDAIVVQELTEYEIVSETLIAMNGASGCDVTQEGEEEDDGNDENVIPIMEAANMLRSLECFIITRKDVLKCVLESSEVLQEFT